jgi:hypothetical protein
LFGESKAILKAKAETTLILTPPSDGRSAAELEEDDGDPISATCGSKGGIKRIDPAQEGARQERSWPERCR